LAFLATCCAYEVPPLTTVGRVLICRVGAGRLVELFVEVGQVIFDPEESCVSVSVMGSDG